MSISSFPLFNDFGTTFDRIRSPSRPAFGADLFGKQFPSLGKVVDPKEESFKSDELLATPSNFFKAPRVYESSNQELRLDSRHFEKYKQSTQLNIRTQDGDEVTINIKSQGFEVENLEYRKSENSEGDSYDELTYESVQREQTRFRFEIEGDLDEDEREAIYDLLSDVDELSEKFFGGDIQAAYQQATQLGFDSEELSGYSLQLEERRFSIEETVYQNNAETAGQNFPEIGRPLYDYLSKVENLLRALDELIEPAVLTSIEEAIFGEKTDSDEERDELVNQFRDFNKTLLNTFGVGSLI